MSNGLGLGTLWANAPGGPCGKDSVVEMAYRAIGQGRIRPGGQGWQQRNGDLDTS